MILPNFMKLRNNKVQDKKLKFLKQKFEVFIKTFYRK